MSLRLLNPMACWLRSMCWLVHHHLSVSALRAEHSGSRGLPSDLSWGTSPKVAVREPHVPVRPEVTLRFSSPCEQLTWCQQCTTVSFRWSLSWENSLSCVAGLSSFGCRAAGTSQRAPGAPGRSDRSQPPAPVGPGQRRGLTHPVLHGAGARAAWGTVADLLLIHQPRGHSL